jgi:hypothetical protein
MTEPVPDVRAPQWSAWPLPVMAGLLPLVAATLAYSLSIRLDIVEGCNPFFDGCTSISRAARHGLPNHLFRALVLPAAALQAICWLMCGSWLRSVGAAPSRMLRLLPVLGIAAAVFLVLYGTFLGVEGAAYRWMRRYGVVVYFGTTCVSMLIVSDAVYRLASTRSFIAGALVAFSVGLPLLGLANAFAPLFGLNETGVAALQNSTEWWGGLLFTLFFFALAWLWRTSSFAIRFSATDGLEPGGAARKPAERRSHGTGRKP